MAWWLWIIVAIGLAVASAGFAFLSLSAGTAFGAHYHALSARQRVMARIVYTTALMAAIACALAGIAVAIRTAMVYW